ncbi:phytosulfokines 3-like isoform X2 [Amaranthus tricolor]|uniref:phytosulfokines 3-like isoform X2 n=1 Tax=Amaranthus tricolor TaxID=29722 RepID=UPI002590AD29|nr:phytosulfokines 3-like isoform X2 [Amaranthus tricolor]
MAPKIYFYHISFVFALFFLLSLEFIHGSRLVPTPQQSNDISTNQDDCTSMEGEDCLMNKSMIAHTDYIYTQDIKDP